MADSIILKIIANSNALTLKSSDNDTTATGNIYKGVELVPGSGSVAGMFGMYKMTTATVAAELCLNDAIATTATTRRICSTYSNYVTYTDA